MASDVHKKLEINNWRTTKIAITILYHKIKVFGNRMYDKLLVTMCCQ